MEGASCPSICCRVSLTSSAPPLRAPPHQPHRTRAHASGWFGHWQRRCRWARWHCCPSMPASPPRWHRCSPMSLRVRRWSGGGGRLHGVLDGWGGGGLSASAVGLGMALVWPACLLPCICAEGPHRQGTAHPLLLAVIPVYAAWRRRSGASGGRVCNAAAQQGRHHPHARASGVLLSFSLAQHGSPAQACTIGSLSACLWLALSLAGSCCRSPSY